MESDRASRVWGALAGLNALLGVNMEVFTVDRLKTRVRERAVKEAALS